MCVLISEPGFILGTGNTAGDLGVKTFFKIYSSVIKEKINTKEIRNKIISYSN